MRNPIPDGQGKPRKCGNRHYGEYHLSRDCKVFQGSMAQNRKGFMARFHSKSKRVDESGGMMV
jgi:hypothetical protein